MKITQKAIDRFIELSSTSDYDYIRKQEYRNLGRRILKFIAQELNLNPGEFDIRWNPGGMACSGDHTLHTDKFYLALHDNLGFGWFYWRTVTGRKDYTGERNQNVSWNVLKTKGLQPLIEALRIVQAGGYWDENEDFVMTKPMVWNKAVSCYSK